MFYNKFVNLCNKKGISPSAAAEEMGYQRSVVTRWSKGTEPREATIQKVADYFGVEADTLRAKKENPTVQMDSEVDEVTIELMDIIQNGTDEDRQDLLEMYKMLKRREQR